MDTSKEYARMCERAEEVQKLCPVNIEKTIEFYVDGTYVSDGKNVWIEFGCNEYGATQRYDIEYQRWINQYIWLPRQDQLQEMVKGDGQLSSLLAYFELWVHGKEIIGFLNLTQWNNSGLLL